MSGRGKFPGHSATQEEGIVATYTYLYKRVVLEGTLKHILLAGTTESSIKTRLRLILQSLRNVPPNHIPPNVQQEWDEIQSVHKVPRNPKYAHRSQSDQLLLSLKPKEVKNALEAYYSLFIKVAEGYAGSRTRTELQRGMPTKAAE
jgi:hypothetical protein